MRYKYKFGLFTCFFILFADLYAGKLYELNTVSLQKQELASINVFQRLYFDANDDLIFVRDHILILALSRKVELGVNIPYINQVKGLDNSFGRGGDIKIYLNIATEWFSKYLALNYYVEFNTGSGAEYINPETNPMESYGYEEWRTGIIGFKYFKYLGIHWNLFYVFRGENETGLFDSFFNGDTLNIFGAEAYKRGLGLNPAHETSFLYYKNFKNDNIELNLAINTDLFYPFVIFLEATLSFDFGSEFISKAPGSGIMRNQVILGTKIFLIDQKLVIKFASFMPIGPLFNIYRAGIGLGVAIHF